MKRTASWSWVDLAWAVVVRLDNASQPERVVMALPKMDPATVAESGVSGASSPGPEGLLQRGLQKIGTVDLGMGGPSRSSPTSRIASSSYGTGHLRSTSPESTRRVRRASEDAATAVDDHWDHEGPSHAGDVPLAKEGEECGVTDAEGWTYGDNKWEGAGSKNGIGKVRHEISFCRRILPMLNCIRHDSSPASVAGHALCCSQKPSKSYPLQTTRITYASLLRHLRHRLSVSRHDLHQPKQ